jgi:hypothetical protein
MFVSECSSRGYDLGQVSPLYNTKIKLEPLFQRSKFDFSSADATQSGKYPRRTNQKVKKLILMMEYFLVNIWNA